jgi:hypothetical protein
VCLVQARRGRRARAQREESLALETALHDAVAAQDFRRAGKLLARLRRRSLLWKLSSRLEGAVGAGRFEDAARLKRAIVRKYAAWLSAPLLEALGHACARGGRAPRAAEGLDGGLRVGDLVRHRAGGWRGVVVGWHPPPPPSLPYKVDTSRPSLRTNWTRLVPRPVLTGHVSSLAP